MDGMKYSGVVVARDKVEYGYVVAGEDDVFRFVVASFVDHGVRIISAKTKEVDEDQIEKFADAHRTFAKLMSDRRCHSRYMEEVLSYVRSLPRGCRFEHLMSNDLDRRHRAEEQVRDALLKALAEDDAYRASVTFEVETPFLRADRGIVSVMDRVVADAARFYLEGEVEFLVRVADSMEDQVVGKSPFLMEQVARVKAFVRSSGAPSPR